MWAIRSTGNGNCRRCLHGSCAKGPQGSFTAYYKHAAPYNLETTIITLTGTEVAVMYPNKLCLASIFNKPFGCQQKCMQKVETYSAWQRDREEEVEDPSAQSGL